MSDVDEEMFLRLFDEAVAGTGTRPRCPSPWDTGSGPCSKAYSVFPKSYTLTEPLTELDVIRACPSPNTACLSDLANPKRIVFFSS